MLTASQQNLAAPQSPQTLQSAEAAPPTSINYGKLTKGTADRCSVGSRYGASSHKLPANVPENPVGMPRKPLGSTQDLVRDGTLFEGQNTAFFQQMHWGTVVQ
jgi:hypothetical protein